MGLSFRKSVSLGPVRLNFSRSGVGASVGVRGARVGTGPRGAYVQVGAGGVYYRQSLGTRGDSGAAAPGSALPPALPRSRAPHPAPTPRPAPPGFLAPVHGGDVAAMVDASGGDVLARLNEVAGRVSALAVVGGVAAAVLGFAALNAAAAEVFASLLAVAAVGLAVAWRADAGRLRLDLRYDVSGPVQGAFAALAAAVDDVGRSALVRRVDAHGATDDWKRNAGAGALVNAADVRPSSGLPPRVTSNIAVPVLPAGRQTLYLFPDRILVREGSRYGAVPYAEVLADATATNFIEERATPHDAQQVGTTWRYVNKGGGPDRRFNNNRQLPVYVYGQLDLTSASGLRSRFHCSRPDAVRRLADAVRGVARAHGSTALPPAPRRRA